MKRGVSKLEPLLWSKGMGKIDKERDKIYIIHQVLSYGDLEDIRHLFRIYNKKEIKETFIKFPKKIYQPAVFYFIKNFVLSLRNKPLKEEDYVKTLF